MNIEIKPLPGGVGGFRFTGVALILAFLTTGALRPFTIAADGRPRFDFGSCVNILISIRFMKKKILQL